MKKSKIGGCLILAFLVAENRFFQFADRSDRLVMLFTFALIFILCEYLNTKSTLYKDACEKQAERWSDAVKKNNTFSSTRK